MICRCSVPFTLRLLYFTFKQDATTKHGLSVVSQELGITLTQRGISDKTYEVPVSTQILKAFDVSGKIITTDALLTQRACCAQLADAGGDYVLPVHRNDPLPIF